MRTGKTRTCKSQNPFRGALLSLFILAIFSLWPSGPIKAADGVSDEVRDSRSQSSLINEAFGESLVKPFNPQRKTGSPLDLAITREQLPPLENLEGLRHVVHQTKPGDTLAGLLRGFGLSRQQRLPWIRSVEKQYAANKLPVGKEIHFYFTRSKPSLGKGTTGGQLRALDFDINEEWNLSWEKSEKGIIFKKREKPHDVELKTVGGVVENSFFEDGHNAGLSSALLTQLADIFTWELDLGRDIQKGDSFKILYEKRSRPGREDQSLLRILAAELESAGQKLFAIYFEKEKGKGTYYDLSGRSLARAFLRFPLEFSGISSAFSQSRFHPILKVDRPHLGVDFAAKRGTPVRAIGDGKVLHAGWRKGGYGRLVELQHDESYSSRYAHLQRLARGIRKGVTVKKGQIIGYVGSSGRTTGPHLHFELYRDQEYIDPLKFDFPPEDRIEPSLQRIFEDAKQLFLVELAVPPQS